MTWWDMAVALMIGVAILVLCIAVSACVSAGRADAAVERARKILARDRKERDGDNL